VSSYNLLSKRSITRAISAILTPDEPATILADMDQLELETDCYTQVCKAQRSQDNRRRRYWREGDDEEEVILQRLVDLSAEDLVNLEYSTKVTKEAKY
jgi:hypothetical protein